MKTKVLNSYGIRDISSQLNDHVLCSDVAKFLAQLFAVHSCAIRSVMAVQVTILILTYLQHQRLFVRHI